MTRVTVFTSQGSIKMKVAALIASLAPFFAKDAKPDDISAAVDAQLALDKSAKDKAAKDKAAKDKAAADKAKAAKDAEAAGQAGTETTIVHNVTGDEEEVDGEDEDNEDPNKSGKGSAKDKGFGLGGKDRKAMDAAIDVRVKSAVAADRALTEARQKVQPVIGIVAYDSAPEVYKAALVKLGITVDGVDPSAYGTLFDVATKASPVLATDGATDGKTKSMSEGFKHFDRIRR